MLQVTNQSIVKGSLICFKEFLMVLIFVTFLDNEGVYRRKKILYSPSYKVTKLQKITELQSYKVTKLENYDV